MKSNIATSDKSIVNPIIVNGEIVGYLPLEIPDDSKELIKNFREEKIRVKQEWNADRRNRELIEAIKSEEKQVNVPKAIFNKETNTLHIGNYSYLTRGFRLELLQLIFKNDKSKKAKWLVGDVYEALEDEASEGVDRFSLRLRSHHYGINKQIASKTKLIDFLFFRDSAIWLNPQYL